MRKFKGFTLIELMIVVAIIGILAALAIPNFMRFQARSKQSEAKANLKSVFTAEKSYYAEHDTYSPYVADIGFGPERGNRYAYFIGATVKLEDRTTSKIVSTTTDTGVQVDAFKYGTAATVSGAPALTPGAVVYTSMTLPTTTFSAGASGNIDTDTTVFDFWELSSISASAAAAVCGNSETTLAAGQPYNQYNDVSCE